MMAVVMKGLDQRRMLRHQNTELAGRLAGMETQSIRYKELQELHEEQQRILDAKMKKNEDLSIKIIGLERDLDDAQEAKRADLQRARNDLKLANDFAEAVSAEKAQLQGRLVELDA